MLFKEVFITLSFILIYGWIGGFAIVPFRNQIKFPILAAPMAGMLLWAMGVFSLYSFLKLSLPHSILIVAVFGISITSACLFYIKPKINWRDISFLVLLIMFLGIIISYLLNYTSIQLGGSGFLFKDGSDHLGYAPMADWLQTHTVDNPPIEDPKFPYQSFPEILVDRDPRFGSFFTLSIISFLINQPSMFAFDNACAIVLLTGYLGVASLFSRSRKTLLLLLIALFFSFWFIFSRSGYFGKIIGFPSAFYILGLYLAQQKNRITNSHKNDLSICAKHINITNSPYTISIILLLTFAAAMAYPGYVLSLFLFVVGTLFLLFKLINLGFDFYLNHASKTHSHLKLYLKELMNIRDSFGILLIMILIGFAAFGLLSHPKPIHYAQDIAINWLNIFLFQFDLIPLTHDILFTWMTPNIKMFFLILSIALIIISLSITLIKRHFISSALFAASLIFFLTPFLFSKNWISYQLSGSLYPLFIFGLIAFIDDLSYQENYGPQTSLRMTNVYNQVLKYGFFFILILAMAIRMPSLIEAVYRYSYSDDQPYMQYSKKELNHLAHIIGKQSVIIDIPNSMFALPILVEFGRRDMDLQWTPETWKFILDYRHWSPPAMKKASFILTLKKDPLTLIGRNETPRNACRIIAETRQYYLFVSDQS